MGKLKEALRTLEKTMVAEALERHNFNICRTSKELGISRPTLYDMIERNQIAIPDKALNE